jgi:hypothetical protein
VIRSLVGWVAWIVMVCATSACIFHYLDTRPYVAIMTAGIVVGVTTVPRPNRRT